MAPGAYSPSGKGESLRHGLVQFVRIPTGPQRRPGSKSLPGYMFDRFGPCVGGVSMNLNRSVAFSCLDSARFAS
jgi:hypothetical protein